MNVLTVDHHAGDSSIDAIVLDTVDSTNEEAKRRLRAGSIRSTSYVLAGAQTAGKGSRGRTWASPRGAGLYLSVVETAWDKPLPTTTAYTVAAAVACAEALLECTGINVQLKPVNDLLFEGRKLGGILTESLVQQAGTQALITGVGINVARAGRPVTEGALAPIALQDFLPPHQFAALTPHTLATEIAARIHHWNHTVATGDHNAVRDAWDQFKLPDTDCPIGH